MRLCTLVRTDSTFGQYACLRLQYGHIPLLLKDSRWCHLNQIFRLSWRVVGTRGEDPSSEAALSSRASSALGLHCCNRIFAFTGETRRHPSPTQSVILLEISGCVQLGYGHSQPDRASGPPSAPHGEFRCPGTAVRLSCCKLLQ